ncbi:MAG: hypothetical protein WD793_09830 [Steroidobacteraceae bacterium]
MADEIAKFHERSEIVDFELMAYLVAERFKHQPGKACAVSMRMLAMAHYLESSDSRPWTLPKESDGGVPTQSVVLAAAAVHPLVLVGEQVEFEPESFAARILEMADHAGRA